MTIYFYWESSSLNPKPLECSWEETTSELNAIYLYRKTEQLDERRRGWGSPRGLFPARGGDGKKVCASALAGTGVGNFAPHGDGHGRSIPNGEFPVAIPIQTNLLSSHSLPPFASSRTLQAWTSPTTTSPRRSLWGFLRYTIRPNSGTVVSSVFLYG
jgi:hypothetical protein